MKKRSRYEEPIEKEEPAPEPSEEEEPEKSAEEVSEVEVGMRCFFQRFLVCLV
jgi:hypothetical protein